MDKQADNARDNAVKRRYAHLAPNHLQNAVNMLNIAGQEKRTVLLYIAAGH